jgi:16S rRNA (guanine966-N2)-methyltransferase
VRITGGEFRSRALKAPRGAATRPTSDRVREALFAILGPRVQAARVLDLYAGTGALGLEALSRGAERATFVERSREALAALSANVASLGLGARARILAQPVERPFSGLDDGEKFDLLFADPPYADVPAAVRALEEIVRRGALAENATVVLEHAKERGSKAETGPSGPEILGLTREDTRRYGDSCLSFYSLALPGLHTGTG